MPKFDGFANLILNAVVMNSGGASWLPDVGMVPCGNTVNNTELSLPIELRLTTAVCSSGGTPSDAMAGQSLVGSGWNNNSSWPVGGSSATASNTGALTFSNCPAFTWQDVYLTAQGGVPSSDALVFGGTAIGKTVNAGDTVLISPGNLVETSAGGHGGALCQGIQSLVLSSRDATYVSGSVPANGFAVGETITVGAPKIYLSTQTMTIGVGATEPTGGSYVAQSPFGCFANAAVSGLKQNSSPFTFSNMPSCTVNDWCYGSGSSANQVFYYGGNSFNKTINPGDSVLLDQMVFTEA